MDAITKGSRVLLVKYPTDCDSRAFPLTVGRIYRVIDLEGNNVRTTCDRSPGIVVVDSVSYNRDRVIPITKFSKLINGGWDATAGFVRFTFFKPTTGVPLRGVDYRGDWSCRAYADGDQFHVRASSREEGIRELVEMVLEAREERALWNLAAVEFARREENLRDAE